MSSSDEEMHSCSPEEEEEDDDDVKTATSMESDSDSESECESLVDTVVKHHMKKKPSHDTMMAAETIVSIAKPKSIYFKQMFSVDIHRCQDLWILALPVDADKDEKKELEAAKKAFHAWHMYHNHSAGDDDWTFLPRDPEKDHTNRNGKYIGVPLIIRKAHHIFQPTVIKTDVWTYNKKDHERGSLQNVKPQPHEFTNGICIYCGMDESEFKMYNYSKLVKWGQSPLMHALIDQDVRSGAKEAGQVYRRISVSNKILLYYNKGIYNQKLHVVGIEGTVLCKKTGLQIRCRICIPTNNNIVNQLSIVLGHESSSSAAAAYSTAVALTPQVLAGFIFDEWIEDHLKSGYTFTFKTFVPTTNFHMYFGDRERVYFYQPNMVSKDSLVWTGTNKTECMGNGPEIYQGWIAFHAACFMPFISFLEWNSIHSHVSAAAANR